MKLQDSIKASLQRIRNLLAKADTKSSARHRLGEIIYIAVLAACMLIVVVLFSATFPMGDAASLLAWDHPPPTPDIYLPLIWKHLSFTPTVPAIYLPLIYHE